MHSRDNTLPPAMSSARVAVLATLGANDGAPHLVPVVFAIVGTTVVTAIDHKPKRTSRLQRLRNIEADARVSILVHHYDEDWQQLSWTRGDGRAVIETEGEVVDAALDALEDKYRHYSGRRPAGPVIVIEIDRWVEWAAAG